jgi:hypothetical protein
VEQGIGFAVSFEVAASVIEEDIRDEKRRGDNALAESYGFGRKIKEKGECDAGQIHRYQSRKYPADTAIIKFKNAVCAAADVSENDPSDEVARNDKEDVDADKSPRHGVGENLKMKEDDRKYCEGSKAIDIRAVGGASGCERGH